MSIAVSVVKNAADMVGGSHLAQVGERLLAAALDKRTARGEGTAGGSEVRSGGHLSLELRSLSVLVLWAWSGSVQELGVGMLGLAHDFGGGTDLLDATAYMMAMRSLM